MKNKGFTLIELLVVVLIIGILASIALPQYYRAVNRAKFAEADVILDAFKKNMALYRSAHGWSWHFSPWESSTNTPEIRFTGINAEGDIEMPGTCPSTEWEHACETDSFLYGAGCYNNQCYIEIMPKFLSEGSIFAVAEYQRGGRLAAGVAGDNESDVREMCRYLRDRGYNIVQGCGGNNGGDDGGDDDGGGEPPLG